MLYEELLHKVLDAVFAVYRELGPGLLEQCYHNAMYYELAGFGLQVGYNVPFTVSYKRNVVGEYFADLLGYLLNFQNSRVEFKRLVL